MDKIIGKFRASGLYRDITNIINYGVGTNTNNELAKRLKLTNSITLTILFFIIPYIFIFYLLGYHLPALELIPIGLLFIPVFYLNTLGKILTSRLWLIILINIVLGTYGSYFGKGTGIHLIFFVFLGIPFLIFSLKEIWPIIIGITLPCFAIYFIQYDGWPYSVKMPLESQKTLYFCMITLIIVSTVMNYIYLSVAHFRSEENLHTNEEMFRNLIEGGPDAVIVCDDNGTIQLINHRLEKMFAHNKDELIGVHLEMLIPTPYRSQFPRYMKLFFSSRNKEFVGKEIEFMGLHKNGWEFPVELMLSPLVTNGSKKVAISIRDISKRKEVEHKLILYNQQLESKNKELEQFVFIASHDLQEPLRTVTSFTDLLADKYSEKFDDTGQKSLRFITKATGRMSQLIKGLLDYGRLGNNSVAAMVDLNNAVESVRNDLALAIEECNASILNERLPKIRGYETELRLLFQNLINNAIKFRKKNVPLEIKISAIRKDGNWQLSVSDNGIGIEQEFKEKIFLLFQRLHSRDEYEGTGIGLAHCRKIVELHNGKIWVDSQPNEGSTFYFTINL